MVSLPGPEIARAYTVLGVQRDASPNTVRRYYHKRCLALHPDKAPKDDASQNEAKQRFQELQESYNKISTELTNAKLRGAATGAAPGGASAAGPRFNSYNFGAPGSFAHSAAAFHQQAGYGPSASTASAGASGPYGFNQYHQPNANVPPPSSAYMNPDYRDPFANTSWTAGASNTNDTRQPAGSTSYSSRSTSASTNNNLDESDAKLGPMGARGLGRWGQTKAASSSTNGAASSSSRPNHPQAASTSSSSSTSYPQRQQQTTHQQAERTPAATDRTNGTGIPSFQYRDTSNLREEFIRPGPRNEAEENDQLEEDHRRYQQQLNRRDRELAKMKEREKMRKDKEKIRKDMRARDMIVRLVRSRAALNGAKFALIPTDFSQSDAMVIPPETKNAHKPQYTRQLARNNMRVSNVHFFATPSKNDESKLLIEDRSSNGTMINGTRIPGRSMKMGKAEHGDTVTVGAAKPNIDLVVDYDPHGKKFDTADAMTLFTGLEKMEITREFLARSGLAREIRMWLHCPPITKGKFPEVQRRADHIFKTWREKCAGTASSSRAPAPAKENEVVNVEDSEDEDE
ncbi:unnamed protein product [Amoebophrya sp. A25]|nr:unnamed protein product [Amoebophrya sp. A25]|eukprot:GSA25T00005997001.1